MKLDKAANKVRGEVKVISAKGSKIPVVVIPTNEELMIARDTVRVLGEKEEGRREKEEGERGKEEGERKK